MKKIIELEREDFFNKDINNPLRKISEPVTTFNTSELKLLIKEITDVFYSYSISVGLSAPQIGINKRIIIVNTNKKDDDDLIMINPKIISNTGKKKTSFESCLSLPRYKGKVTRKDKLEIEFYDTNGAKHYLETSGFMSRVILHEIDHLNGILYVDYLNSEDQIEHVGFNWE